MRKCLALVCISLLVIGLNVPAPTLAKEAIVHTDHLNVRSGPGTDYEKVDQVNTDEVYTVISKENDWVEIELDNDTGWITNEYITISDTDSQDDDSGFPTDKNGENKADTDDNNASGSDSDIMITTDNTQIRDEPSTDGDIIYFASENESFHFVSEKDGWYEIENSSVNGFVHQRLISDEQEDIITGLHNKTIVLDAGHGGRDVGAIGESGSYEKTFTFQTTKELKNELELLGANVILTRDDDEFISLGGRTSLTNVKDTDALVSIHYNSTPDLPQVSGIGTYYYHDQDKELAQAIQTGLIQTTDANDRGVAFENFHVIRQSFKPSILIELGFLSNKKEEDLLKSAPYQKKIVTGIIHGLQSHFSN